MYAFAFAAAAIALYFIAASVQSPRPARILAAILWAAYSGYEYFVANGTLCDANCNIRGDLVFFLPLLGGAAYLALQKEPRIGAVSILYVICLGLVAWLSVVFGYNAVAVIACAGALIAAVYGIKSTFAGHRS